MKHNQWADHDAKMTVIRKLSKNACKVCGEHRTLCECIRLTDGRIFGTVGSSNHTRREN